MKTKITSVFLIATLMVGCSSEDEKLAKEAENIEKKIENIEKKIGLSEEDKRRVDDLLSEIPSPIELSYIIKALDLKFSPSVLNPTDNISKYVTPQVQALNVGVYSSNIVYCNVYNRKDISEEYLKNIQILFEKLGMENVIDFNRIMGEENKSLTNKELAMRLGMEFEKVYDYLKSNDKESLSVLMLFGGWIESLYQTVKATESINAGKKELIEIIYDESIVLDSFKELFSTFEKEPTMDYYKKMVEDLQALFNDIESNSNEESTTEVSVSNDVTIAINKSNNTVNITDQKFEEINQKITSIRNQITKI